MNIHKITEKFFVSAQIEAADAPAVVDAGIVRVICNRPDQEVPAALQADAIGAAVRAAGIDFAVFADHPSINDAEPCFRAVGTNKFCRRARISLLRLRYAINRDLGAGTDWHPASGRNSKPSSPGRI